MQKTIMAAIFAIGALTATGAFALPVTHSDDVANNIHQVRTVCDEDGRCVERRTDVGADIARGVLRGVEGRSVYRDRDDRYRRDRDFDRRDYRGGRGYDGDY